MDSNTLLDVGIRSQQSWVDQTTVKKEIQELDLGIPQRQKQ